MKTFFLKNTCKFPGIFLFCILAFFLSCKKDTNSPSTSTTPEIPVLPDLQTKVNSSVSGFVTDQNDAPVVGAEVTAGSTTTFTDRYGYFEIKNVEVVKEAATVTVSYMGYFKAIKTYMATEGKAAFFRIKLLQKTIIGSVDATTGGNVSLSNGLNISFPSNAIKDEDGNIYNGTVNVAAQYLDPTSAALNNLMPGDLRGLNTGGYMKGLTSFGMMGVELTGNSGELLQIADGKKSTITMRLPSSILSEAPATIPLWHFDESNGLWKEEGAAIKTGSTYVGEVSHFSWWNCDLPNATVPLTFTILDEENRPVNYAGVEIESTTPNSWGHIGGGTDSTGYVSVFVTPNTSYLLKVYGVGCGGGVPAYSTNFDAHNAAIDLGNIVMPDPSMATISGTITNCNNQPVSTGRLVILNGNTYTYYTLNNGVYNVSLPICGQNIIITGIDLNNDRQSVPASYSIHAGINQPINIQACCDHLTDPGCPCNDPSDPGCPIDGGLGLLIAAAIGLGARNLYKKKTTTVKM